MSAICRKSWPSMPATSTAGAHTVRLDNVRPARRCHLRRIDAPKLEGSSQYPCSEVSIMFMSGPHDRPIQFLRPTGLHSNPPGAVGGDRLFHGSADAARTGDLLRAVFHPS